jgi:hypothetical protein
MELNALEVLDWESLMQLGRADPAETWSKKLWL